MDLSKNINKHSQQTVMTPEIARMLFVKKPEDS
jgi:hypothetical protein